jgi:hypothetical protein
VGTGTITGNIVMIDVHTTAIRNNMVRREPTPSRRRNHFSIARKHVMPHENHGFQINSTTDFKEVKAVVCEVDLVVLVSKQLKKR